MHPIDNKHTTPPTPSARIANNVGASNPNSPVSQLNNAANRPEGLQEASQLQMPDRHFTRLMRLIFNPQTTFTQEDLKTIDKIESLENKKKVLEDIVGHVNVSDEILAVANKLLQDVQEDLTCSTEYTAQNIWEAYTDAHKICRPEKQINFLKRILQSHIDMRGFVGQPAWKQFQSLINSFSKSIQRDLYHLIVCSEQCSLYMKMLVVNETELSLAEKETHLSKILEQLLRKRLSGYDFEIFQSSLKDCSKPIQNKFYIQIAENECDGTIRLRALESLDIPLAEKITLCCEIFSADFCQILSEYSNAQYFKQFLLRCPKELQLELCAQIVKHDSLQSPFRIQIVELMEAGPVKDEALSVMLGSDFFKLEDKIKLAKLINDSSLKLTILENLLVHAPYIRFRHFDKYETMQEFSDYNGNISWWECCESIELRLRLCDSTGIIQNVSDLKDKIIEKFFSVLSVESIVFFTNCLNQVFIKRRPGEKEMIMLNFTKTISKDWQVLGNSADNDEKLLRETLIDGFDCSYKTLESDKDTEKELLLNLLHDNSFLLYLLKNKEFFVVSPTK